MYEILMSQRLQRPAFGEDMQVECPHGGDRHFLAANQWGGGPAEATVARSDEMADAFNGQPWTALTSFLVEIFI